MAVLLALFSSALWGSADFEGGRMAKKYPAIAVTGVSQALGLVIGLCIVLISGGWRASAFGAHGYFFPGVLAGVSGYLGLIALYAGLATGRMGVVSPISSLSAIIPVTVALIGGERLPTSQVLGIVIALIGAFCASGPEISQGFPIRPILLAGAAAVGFGTALTFMARGSLSSALMTMVMMRVTTLMISIGLAAKYRTLGGLAKREIPRLIYIGCADFAANLLIGVASTRGSLSIVMVLGSLFPIMTVVLAYQVLHERLHRVQYLGIFLALLGVTLISAT